jgi:large subunit ribosomal protein L25
MATAQSQAAPKSIRKAAADGIVNLTAQARTVVGKGEAKRLRASGFIPAVAYGKGLTSALLSVSPKDVLAILTSERSKNTVISMELGAHGKLLVMIKDYTYHPVHRGLEHVDFFQVKLDQPVEVDVPLVPLGKPPGVVAGGIIRVVYRTVPVRCVPDKIPLKLEIEIGHLELNEHVSTQDLKMPEGVTVRLPAEQTLIAVVTPEKEREEDVAVVDPAAAAAAAGAAAPGAPGAPAAAGAEAGKDAKGGAAPAAAPAKEAKKK